MCLPHSWDRRVWKKYYPSSASGTPLHICLMAMWLIILGIPIQEYPQEATAQQGSLFASSVPPTRPPALVFHSLSYREWGPLLNLTGHLENDHLRDFSHKRLNNTVYGLSIGGRVRVHAQGARCTTWLGFHGVILDDSSWLRHAILLTATKMFCLFWLGLLWSAQVALWGEGDGWKKGGVKVQTKGSHQDALFSYQICGDTKRATVSSPRAPWGGEKKLQENFFCACVTSSAAQASKSSFFSSLRSYADCRSWLVAEAEPVGFLY